MSESNSPEDPGQKTDDGHSATIEERILRLPECQSAQSNPDFKKFTEQFAPYLALTGWSSDLIQPIETKDARILQITETLKDLPELRGAFMKFIQVLRSLDESETTLEQCVLIYGIDSCRDLLIANDIHLNLYGRPIEWDETTSRPKIEINEFLKFAKKTEEEQGEGSRFAHMAYASGLVFDIISHTIEKYSPDHKAKLMGLLDEIYEHGKKTHLVVDRLSRKVDAFRLAEYAMPMSFLHDIGKILLAFFDPKYLDWHQHFESNTILPSLRQLLEKKNFSSPHSFFTGLVFQSFRPLRPVWEAAFSYHAPYLLHQKERMPLYNLASITLIGSHIANKPQTDHIERDWKRLEVQHYEVEDEDLSGAAASAQ